MMVFVFGLIHGFGLSTRLQQLPLGDRGREMFMRIISFNIGVEVGQLLFITAVMTISFLAIKTIPALDKSQVAITQLTIYFIGSCSAYWLFERSMSIV